MDFISTCPYTLAKCPFGKDACTLMSGTIIDNGEPLKKDEKCFLFHLKSLFVLKIYKFSSWLFNHV